MIKSITPDRLMNFMKSICHNIPGQSHTSAHHIYDTLASAIRTVMLCLMLIMAGHVSADEVKLEPKSTEADGSLIYAQSDLKNVVDNSILRIYVDKESLVYLEQNEYKNAIFLFDDEFVGNNRNAIYNKYIPLGGGYYNSKKGCFEIVVNSKGDATNRLKNNNLKVFPKDGQTITKVTIDVLPATDTYTAAPPEIIVQKDMEITSSEKQTFDFSEVLKEHPNIKYARIYLGSSKNVEADITCAGTKFADNAERGYYIYKDGEPLTADDLKGTLDMPALDLYNKTLVAVFSENEPTMADGVPTKEPTLCAQYEYNLIKPTKVIHQYLDSNTYDYIFDITDLPDQFGTTLEKMEHDYSIAWYAIDESTGEKYDIWQTTKQAYFDTKRGINWGPYRDYRSIYQFSVTSLDALQWGNRYYTFDEGWPMLAHPWVRCQDTKKTFETTGVSKIGISNIICDAKSYAFPQHVKYYYHFNRQGIEPSTVDGDMSDAEDVKEEIPVRVTSGSTPIDLSSVLTGTKYARYYLIDKNGCLYEGNNEDVGVPFSGGVTVGDKNGIAVYNDGNDLTADQMKVRVNLPAGTYYDYRLLIMLSDEAPTKDADGSIIKDGKITKRLICPFNKAFQFIHSKGASGRDFIIGSNKDKVLQAVWNGECTDLEGTATETTKGIRQGVHTVTYEVYVDPAASVKKYKLNLPLMNYDGDGAKDEPSTYIRWYDWETDFAHTKLESSKSGNDKLKDLLELMDDGTERSRGLFRLNKTEGGTNMAHSYVGVTFDASDFKLDEVDTIACDISKYYDGIEGSKETGNMVHEPTIGTRYLFVIRHAKILADKIEAGKVNYETKDPNKMFNLAEDHGRYCVSIKDNSTTFTLRPNKQKISDYFIYDETKTDMVQCEKLGWDVYLENDEGLWKKNSSIGAEANRIRTSSVSGLGGDYTLVGGTTPKKVTAQAGMRFHLVGIMQAKNGAKAPVIHYEMNFLTAPAYTADNIPVERKGAYLKENMELKAQLTFDNMFEEGGELSDVLEEQSHNHSMLPLEWDEAEYAYCYPQLAHYHTKKTTGLSPIHGDYIIVKSMNDEKASVSVANSYDNYYWYNSAKLYDYTYLYGGENKGKHGGFIYFDASEEARTIAKLKFKANLCAGAELCYTAVVADMTTAGKLAPRLNTSVYAIKENGERVHVVSFLSCDLKAVAIVEDGKEYEYGRWYQVYGKITVPQELVETLGKLEDYEVHVGNYSQSTNGADYCIDQIMFFTTNAKMNVKQVMADCGDEQVRTNVYIEESALPATTKTIHWRFYDENKRPVPNGYTDRDGVVHKLYGEDDNLTYGTLTIPERVKDETLKNIDDFTSGNEEKGYFVEDNKVMFSLINRDLYLRGGRKYYVSLFTYGENPNAREGVWGDPDDICSVYSHLFIPSKTYMSLLLNGKDLTIKDVDCSGNEKLENMNLEAEVSIPDENDPTGFVRTKEVHFDFFIGTLSEYYKYSVPVPGAEGNKITLSEAMEHYRGRDITDEDAYTAWEYKDKIGFDKDMVSAAFDNLSSDKLPYKEYYIAVIEKAVNEEILFLNYAQVLDSITVKTGTSELYITALPIEKKATVIDSEGNKRIGEGDICMPLEHVFEIHAVNGVPTLTLGFNNVQYPDGNRVVRVGREQLLNMQKAGGCTLEIPVHSFMTGVNAKPDEGALLILGDLELVKEGSTDPTIDGNKDKVATFTETEVNKEKKFISLDFHGKDVNQLTFHEGFAYKMFFQVKTKDSEKSRCEGNVEFLIKVVPEFVTWTGSNTSWNNDANWTRSVKAELHKDKGENTPTAAQGDGTTPGDYKDNAEINAALKQPATYVPMKFTYVTIPSRKRAPTLKELVAGTDGIYNNMEADATDNIQYDIMVQVEPTTGTSIYNCEKFYGNTCKEIYFKPEAELVNQQHLTYTKAWVEKELVANKWCLMSSPLQATYAGDMYVPTVNGRQETEAFQPINFDLTKDYSRTKYPIYQRSWGYDANVYTKTAGDERANSYEAKLPYPSVVTEKMAEWSHTYNDTCMMPQTAR